MKNVRGILSEAALVTFSVLGQNTQHLQIKGGEIYFGL